MAGKVKGGVAFDPNYKQLKSAMKPGKQTDLKSGKGEKLEDTYKTQYKNFFTSHDLFNINVVPRPLVRELIAVTTREIKARGR